MDQKLKERLIGVIVLVSLAVIFIPLFLTEPVNLIQEDKKNSSSSEDSEFSERFSIADGFFGIQINVYDTNGEFISSVEPGVLRFDSADGMIRPRSEVDRLVDWKGDTILILDLTQMNQIMTHAMLGELDDVDRVRLTVYDLPGSHLVWIGWTMIMFGSILSLKHIRKTESDESE